MEQIFIWPLKNDPKNDTFLGLLDRKKPQAQIFFTFFVDPLGVYKTTKNFFDQCQNVPLGAKFQFFHDLGGQN